MWKNKSYILTRYLIRITVFDFLIFPHIKWHTMYKMNDFFSFDGKIKFFIFFNNITVLSILFSTFFNEYYFVSFVYYYLLKFQLIRTYICDNFCLIVSIFYQITIFRSIYLYEILFLIFLFLQNCHVTEISNVVCCFYYKNEVLELYPKEIYLLSKTRNLNLICWMKTEERLKY